MYTTFDELIHTISPTLRRITRRLGSYAAFLNEEDLFQEAMVHLWTSFNAGELSDKTDSYILQGAYFYLRNYLRTTLDKAALTSLSEILGDEDSGEEALSDGGAAPRAALNESLIDSAVHSIGLTEREEEIFALCMEGRTMREIGHALGISHVAAIKARNRIRMKCMPIKENIAH